MQGWPIRWGCQDIPNSVPPKTRARGPGHTATDMQVHGGHEPDVLGVRVHQVDRGGRADTQEWMMREHYERGLFPRCRLVKPETVKSVCVCCAGCMDEFRYVLQQKSHDTAQDTKPVTDGIAAVPNLRVIELRGSTYRSVIFVPVFVCLLPKHAVLQS